MKELGFGDYVEIEMLRRGAENEMYQHKVIGRHSSNHFVDTPIGYAEKEIIHPKMEIVLCVICCGVDETKVFKVKESDCVRYETREQRKQRMLIEKNLMTTEDF